LKRLGHVLRREWTEAERVTVEEEEEEEDDVITQ